jgi:RNA polymerase sigma-70 factor, ECF subfamily
VLDGGLHPAVNSGLEMTDTDVVMDVVARAREGDPDALGELWRAHQHLLLRYYRARHVRSPEDLASQVWIDVAAGLHRFEGDDDDFRRWLFTIARRRQIDRVRAETRRPEVCAPDAGATELDPVAETAFEAGDALGRALELLATLPPDQAEAVALRVIADLSVTDVAELMGRREGHVRVLVHRGLRRLAAQMGVTAERAPTMNAAS